MYFIIVFVQAIYYTQTSIPVNSLFHHKIVTLIEKEWSGERYSGKSKKN